MKTATDITTNWQHRLPPAGEVDKFHEAVAAAVSPGCYGEWTVTQLIDKSLPEFISSKALDVLIGYRRDMKVQMNDGLGNMVFVTLQVVTRQACAADAQGNRLNTFEMSPMEPPKDGDIVEHQAETRGGRQLDGHMIEQYRARGEREHVYHEYVVKDGRIRVPFIDALNMLHTHGFRLPTAGVQHMSMPPTKAQYEMAQYTGDKPKTRMITNWWFREVFDDGTSEEQPEKRASAARR